GAAEPAVAVEAGEDDLQEAVEVGGEGGVREALLGLEEEVEVAEIAVAEAVVLPRAARQGAAERLLDLAAQGGSLLRGAGMGEGGETGEPDAGGAVAPGDGDRALGGRLLAAGRGAEQALEVLPEALPLAGETVQGGGEEARVGGCLAEAEESEGDPSHAVRDAGERPLGGEAGAPAETRPPRLGEGEEALAAFDGDREDALRAGGPMQSEQPEEGA